MPRNSILEREIQKALKSYAIPFRSNVKELPGSPDLVFDACKTVLFINGCFWHRHLNCKFSVIPKKNISQWISTFNYQVKRDQEVKFDLEALGWCYKVLWECELSPGNSWNSNNLSQYVLNLVNPQFI